MKKLRHCHPMYTQYASMIDDLWPRRHSIIALRAMYYWLYKPLCSPGRVIGRLYVRVYVRTAVWASQALQGHCQGQPEKCSIDFKPLSKAPLDRVQLRSCWFTIRQAYSVGTSGVTSVIGARRQRQ